MRHDRRYRPGQRPQGQGQPGQSQGQSQGQGQNQNRQQQQGPPRHYRSQGGGGHGGPRPGGPPQKSPAALAFEAATAIQPKEKLKLETEPGEISMRILELIAPLGKGQRGLIVAPPRTGKTMLLQKIALAVLKNHPEVHLLVLLVDERPEEVTDFRQSLKGSTAQVLASNNDQDAGSHVRLTESALEQGKQLAGDKKDVVILFDSLTRMTRAYNSRMPGRGRTMSGGLDTGAFLGPRAFFGAARALEGGGSLTIVGTALVDTGSRMDQVIFEEFKGTGNMELYLDRELADKRLFPAFDVVRSGTRREELLVPAADLERMHRLRRLLAERRKEEQIQSLLEQMKKFPTNAEFLRSLG